MTLKQKNHNRSEIKKLIEGLAVSSILSFSLNLLLPTLARSEQAPSSDPKIERTVEIKKPKSFHIRQVPANQNTVFNCIRPGKYSEDYPNQQKPTELQTSELRDLAKGRLLFFFAEFYNYETQTVDLGQYLIILPKDWLQNELNSSFSHPSGLVLGAMMDSVWHDEDFNNILNVCDADAIQKVIEVLKNLPSPDIKLKSPILNIDEVPLSDLEIQSMKQKLETGEWKFYRFKKGLSLVPLTGLKADILNDMHIVAGLNQKQQAILDNIPQLESIKIAEALEFYPFKKDGIRSVTGLNLTSYFRQSISKNNKII